MELIAVAIAALLLPLYVAPAAPTPKIASSNSNKLAIHGPLVYGATPGRPFLYRIPTTGTGALRFTADALPAGLRLDPATGIITGKLSAPGTSDVRSFKRGYAVEVPRHGAVMLKIGQPSAAN